MSKTSQKRNNLRTKDISSEGFNPNPPTNTPIASPTNAPVEEPTIDFSSFSPSLSPSENLLREPSLQPSYLPININNSTRSPTKALARNDRTWKDVGIIGAEVVGAGAALLALVGLGRYIRNKRRHAYREALDEASNAVLSNTNDYSHLPLTDDDIQPIGQRIDSTAAGAAYVSRVTESATKIFNTRERKIDETSKESSVLVPENKTQLSELELTTSITTPKNKKLANDGQNLKENTSMSSAYVDRLIRDLSDEERAILTDLDVKRIEDSLNEGESQLSEVKTVLFEKSIEDKGYEDDSKRPLLKVDSSEEKKASLEQSPSTSPALTRNDRQKNSFYDTPNTKGKKEEEIKLEMDYVNRFGAKRNPRSRITTEKGDGCTIS